MRLSKRVLAGLAFGTVALVLIFWPRGDLPADEVIRRQLITMTRDAEAKKLSSVMENVSDQFVSDDGMRKQELKQFLAAQLLTGSWVRIFTTEMKVMVVSAASADFKGKFIFGKSEAQTLKDLAKDSTISAYVVEGRLEKEADGQWRFVWARYERSQP